MGTDTGPGLALARLMQLISPSLPIGGYTYSQGIEWAVEAGWITSEPDLEAWLHGLLVGNIRWLELPVMRRLLDAWNEDDLPAVAQWSQELLVNRETSELRLEERNRARALAQLLAALEPAATEHGQLLGQTQMTGYCFACHRWNIDYEPAACGLVYSWLENLVLSAVKIIPLGQTAGQRITFRLAESIPDIVAEAAAIPDDDIGASSMAAVIASSLHETQYTRLFRS